MNIEVSIIIVNWNTCDLLAQSLASVFSYPPPVAFEVLVVDNASSDESVSMVRDRFPQVRLLMNGENVGFARANNQAIRVSSGKYVLLLNSDALVWPGTIATLLACAEAHPTVGIVGGQLLNPDGSFQASFYDFPSVLSEGLLLFGLARWRHSPYFPSHTPEASQVSRECDWVSGACLLIRREAVLQVGLLDEDYFMYAEETDWCMRMWRRGWRVFYCAEARVMHYGGQSANRTSPRQQLLLYHSKTLFFLKHHGLPRANAFRALVRLAAALKAAYWLGRSWLTGHDRRCRERAISHWRVALAWNSFCRLPT